MVFDRITLIDIYDALFQIEQTEGPITSILVNRSSKYGIKSLPRFESLAELKTLIQEKYPYQIWNPECECVTCNEGLYSLVSFSIIMEDDTTIAVKNINGEAVSSKLDRLNGASTSVLNQLFTKYTNVNNLYNSYVCFPYTMVGQDYWTPCYYTDFIINKAYSTLIDKYYTLTKRSDFPVIKRTPCR